MKRRMFQFLLMLTCSATGIKAQPVTVPLGLGVRDKYVSQMPGTSWSDQVYISDVNGQPIKQKYVDVNGSPYFNDVFKVANIVLTKGNKVLVNVKTRIDLADQETHFISANGVEAFMFAGMVKEITYADTTADGILFYKFQTGFPAIDRQTVNNFYLVLAEGRCSFLKSIYKRVSEKKTELSGEVVKEFETYEDYYLIINGVMKRWKKDKDFILAELTDKQAQVNQYLLSNKVNFKNAEQVTKLLNYYNSL